MTNTFPDLLAPPSRTPNHPNAGEGNGRFIHGHALKGRESKAYKAWSSMKKRCLDPAHPSYPRYGGRGITVCVRWLESFPAFLADMGEPAPEMSLDRINNDGGYSPDNCRWATRREQQANTSIASIVELNGEKVCVPEAARRLGLNLATLWWRVKNKPESEWFKPARPRARRRDAHT